MKSLSLLAGRTLVFSISGVFFQVDTSSVKFQEALVRLNKCLKEDNLVALKKIQEKSDLTQDEIVVGIGIHLIQTLSGMAETNKKKSMMKCPCGCTGKLDYGEKMYIGNMSLEK